MIRSTGDRGANGPVPRTGRVVEEAMAVSERQRAPRRLLWRRRQVLQATSLGALAVLAAACGRRDDAGRTTATAGTTDYAARFAGYQAADEPNGDLAKVVWPDFVTQAGPEVQQLYAFQVTHGDLMRYIPCFCGCGQSDGHRNNRDCYVAAVNADGSVVFDAMAPT